MSCNEPQYDESIIVFADALWGDKFISPGGREAVAKIVQGIDTVGKKILDIGCGLGGADVCLVQDHKARHVVAVDVESMQVEQTRQLAIKEGYSDQITAMLIGQGPLPFDTESFDIVFSKDAIVHVAEKLDMYQELFRVLKPGGYLAVSDWLRRGDAVDSQDMVEFLERMGVGLTLAPPGEISTILETAGFENVEFEDRRMWHLDQARSELNKMQKDIYPLLVEEIGEEYADSDIHCWQAMIRILENEEFGSALFRAQKPASS